MFCFYYVNSYAISITGTTNNPSQIAVYGIGGDAISKKMNNQTKEMLKTGVLQNVIATELTIIKGWEKKYNRYLKGVEGYANALTAGTSIYTEGIIALRNVIELQKTVAANPEGLTSGIVMSDYYIELFTQLTQAYKNLKRHIAEGGSINMMTGDQRVALLWETAEGLHLFNKNVRNVTMRIKSFSAIQVWDYITRGLGYKDNGQIARGCLRQWQRRAETAIK